MKNLFIFVLAVAVVAGGYMLYRGDTSEPQTPEIETENTESEMSMDTEPMAGDEVNVTPISHATLVLDWGDTTIYVDPVGGAAAFANMTVPDLILLTDIHGDHLDPETLSAVMTPNTALVAPQAVVDELPDELANGALVLANGSTTNQRNLSIEAVPMYNMPESEDAYHVKGRGNGYVLERDGTRVYIAGDTEDTPEMRGLQNIDMAFVPMNLPYTMDVEAAADGVLDFAPATVYPYHYRGQDGLSDVDEFRRLVNEGNPEIEVVLLDWYPEQETASGDENTASAAAAEETDESSETETEGEEVVVDLTGMNYGFSVEEITVNEGDTVTINFTSQEGFHDWAVDAFGIVATDRVRDGETTSVTFVADEAGTFEYYCSVGNHREMGMVGTLTVLE